MESLYHQCPIHDLEDGNGYQSLSYSLASGTDLSIVEELSAFSVHQYQKRRHDLMLSLWPHAPHFAQLCAVPPDASAPLVEEKTRTESAQTRAPFPGLGRSLDAGDLSVRACTAPLSQTCL